MSEDGEFVKDMLLHFTYQVAAFSSQPAMVNHAASLHYQFARHIPTPQPGGCKKCSEVKPVA